MRRTPGVMRRAADCRRDDFEERLENRRKDREIAKRPTIGIRPARDFPVQEESEE